MIGSKTASTVMKVLTATAVGVEAGYAGWLFGNSISKAIDEASESGTISSATWKEVVFTGAVSAVTTALGVSTVKRASSAMLSQTAKNAAPTTQTTTSATGTVADVLGDGVPAVSGKVAGGYRGGSSSVNLPRPGEDGFIGPLTRPEHHFIFGEGIGSKQKGVVGAHNMNCFEQTLAGTGFGVDDLKIGSPVPHPTITGIYSQRYTVPAYDGRGNFISFKNIKDPKTIYDPTVISNRQMLDWGWEAMDNGVVFGRMIKGRASNGLEFVGFIDDNGAITNFFPTLN